MIAEVVFNIPVERAFHYGLPPQLEGGLQPGMRVVAPFGPRQRLGMVIRLLEESPVANLKAIHRVVDPSPVMDEERWALASWLADYYYCSLGEALAAMVPSDLRVSGAASASDRPEAAPPAEGRPALSPAQRRAMRVLTRALSTGRAQTILLHGVTGSGKTELYLQAIDDVLRQGRSAICLIPEIALTPQMTDRFSARFGPLVGLWHSRLTSRQRSIEWTACLQGCRRIVVGTRSAVFAPVRRLGLVMLDEEQEATFKQEEVPRYHTREVARQRIQLTGGVLLLGSATPSVESYYAACRHRDRLLTLPERIGGRPMPAVEIVDMRQELTRRRSAGPLSGRLRRLLEQTLEEGGQAILLLNRRGFARVARCRACGTVSRCPRCSVPLVYHATERLMVCHYCRRRRVPEEICPSCQRGYLRFVGTGTERVESELHRLFPMSSISRMDRDTMGARQSHRQVYEAMKEQDIQLLVGTQMVAKGLDFPEVTLVGVVSADTSLNLPDFRAGERTFDLLTQVAGRAGRGPRPGRVVLQTFCPTHYAIQAAQRHDYRRFFDEEIRMRRRLRLPPFAHLIELTLLSSARDSVEEGAGKLAERLRPLAARHRISLLGPVPDRVSRLRGTYRFCVALKGRSVAAMVGLLRGVLDPGRKFGGLPVLVDVDPL